MHKINQIIDCKIVADSHTNTLRYARHVTVYLIANAQLEISLGH